MWQLAVGDWFYFKGHLYDKELRRRIVNIDKTSNTFEYNYALNTDYADWKIELSEPEFTEVTYIYG